MFPSYQLGTALSGLGGAQQTQNQSQLDTNVVLVGTGDVAAKTAAQLGGGWTARAVRGLISISPNSDTSVVNVVATAHSPAIAQQVANTYATTFVTEQRQQNAAQVSQAEGLMSREFNALTPVEKAGPQGLALADRLESLQLLAKLGNGSVSIAGLASLPSSPSGPQTRRNVLLGGVLGLLIGLAIAFVLERADRRIRDPKELEAVYDLPLLAVVPEHKGYGVLRSFGQSGQSGRSAVYAEVFNLLGSHLRHLMLGQGLRTLLVISAEPGEGKTTVSYNLAKAAAGLGSRVLVIEADLRHRTVVGPLLLDQPEPALPDVLAGRASMEQAIRSLQAGSRGTVDVLIAGKVPLANSGALIGSQAMASLLQQAAEAYDLVVIDTPPLNLIGDAVPLLDKVDGAIIVAAIGKSRRDAAAQLHARLATLDAPALGVIANRARSGEHAGYRYRYRYHRYMLPEQGQIAATNGAGRNGTTPTADVTTTTNDAD